MVWGTRKYTGCMSGGSRSFLGFMIGIQPKLDCDSHLAPLKLNFKNIIARPSMLPTAWDTALLLPSLRLSPSSSLPSSHLPAPQLTACG